MAEHLKDLAVTAGRDKKRQGGGGGGGGKVTRISEQELLECLVWLAVWDPCHVDQKTQDQKMELSSLLLQPGSDWSVCDSGKSPALPGSCSAPDPGPLGPCKGPSPPFC